MLTTDISRMCFREQQEASKLLLNYRHIYDQTDGKVTLQMNENSGYVFLSDEEHNVWMMNGNRIEKWYSCPGCRHEGFKEEMEHDPNNAECESFLFDLGLITEEDKYEVEE
jgi:hypothetical protein|tara:strand:- start:51 stop:383 length:333 start_codon:yes stop_codon:yes gene_type:complete